MYIVKQGNVLKDKFLGEKDVIFSKSLCIHYVVLLKKTIVLDFGKKNLMLDFQVYGRALLCQSFD